MKATEIYKQIHDVVVELVEDEADPGLILSALGVLYVCLCKRSGVGAERAHKAVVEFWADVGDNYRDVLDVVDVVLEEDDAELLN